MTSLRKPTRSRNSQAGPGALIIGGALGSLSMARTLGRRGIPVHYLTSDNTIAKYSKYTLAHSDCPHPEHPTALGWLVNYARQHALEGWALFPGGDPEVSLVSQNHDELSRIFRVATPAWSTTRWAHNKRLTYEKAAALGIDHPRVHRIESRSDIRTKEIRYPVVLKPVSRENTGALRLAKAWRADNQAAALHYYDLAVSHLGEGSVICQEYVPGGGATQFSYAALYEDGAPLASMVALRRIQHPAEFGTATLVTACENDQVERMAERFLGSIGYTGLVEIEFKYDHRDGSYKLLDVNPRLWNWMSLGDISGVEFAYLAWQMLNGESVSPVRGRPGATWIHPARHLVAVGRQFITGKLAAAEIVATARGPLDLSILARDDLRPALVELPVAIWRKSSRIALPPEDQLLRPA